MNHCCSVPHCSSWVKRNPELSFHLFPKDGKQRVLMETKMGKKVMIDRQEAWVSKLKISTPVSKYMRVCSLHFTDNDYFNHGVNSSKKKILKSISVPSQKLPDQLDNVEHSSSRNKRLVKRKENNCWIIDNEIEKHNSNLCCSVPQCSSESKCTNKIFLIKFPQDEKLKKKWTQALRVKEEITENMYVCNLHFLPKDYISLVNQDILDHLQLNEEAVPSQRLPQVLIKSKRLAEHGTLKNENSTLGDEKDSGKTQSSTPIKKGCSVRNEDSMRFKKRSHSNIKQPKKKKTEILKRSKRISSHTQNKKVLKPFVFVSVEMKKNRTKVPVPTKRSQAALVKSRKFVDSKSLSVPVKNKSKSVGVQTDSINISYPENDDMDNQQISLIRSIDYLRKNLMGHAMKVKGKTFKVNECSISFEDQNSGEMKMLIVQPDELVSSGALLLKDIFGNCKIDGLLESTESDHKVSKSSQQYCGNEQVVQYSDVEISDNRSTPEPSCIDSDSNLLKTAENSILNTSGIKGTKLIKDKHVKESSSCPVFGKEIRILVNKLPESLVRAIQDGKQVKVKSKNLKNNNRFLNPKFTVGAEQKLTPQDSSIIHKNFTCESCELKFPSSTYLYEHMRVHEEKSEEMYEQNHEEINNPIEVVEQENEISKDEHYICELCSRTFNYYQSYKFHREIVHGKINVRKELITNSGSYKNCRVKKYKEVNKDECSKMEDSEETCPECLGVYQNMEKLDCHLLECHKTVLKKSLYKCDICPKIFITYRSLVYHKTKTHNVTMTEDVNIKLKCPKCKKLINIKEYKLIHSIQCTIELEQKNQTNIEKSTEITTNAPSNSEKIINSNEERPVMTPHSSFSSQNPLNNSFSENRIIIKRKYTSNSSCDSENENVKEKKFKQNEDIEENVTSSHQILNRLRALLGSSDGPNDITIELDE